MTEMTKEMESRTLGQMTGVYRLAVILVICVIGEEEALTNIIINYLLLVADVFQTTMNYPS
jgi:hypothetical protein